MQQTKGKNRMRVTGSPARRRASAAKVPHKPSEIEIQYTPAKPFNRNRFLLRLATVAAVVLALVLGMSIFFKTRQVMVSGAEKYTPWEVREASGIQDGDALLSLSEAKISAKIQEKLPYVGDVRVGIKLPDTVMLEIVELQVVYAAQDINSAWWLLDASGRIIDRTDAASAMDYTRIEGVVLQEPAVGQQAVAAEPETPESSESETGITVGTLPPVPAGEQLSAAIAVLTALESNGVMGNISTVNVSEPKAMKLWYEDRYLVTLGDTGNLEYKIGAMKAAIQKMGQYQTGYLDISFTIWPNQVGYSPFNEG